MPEFFAFGLFVSQSVLYNYLVDLVYLVKLNQRMALFRTKFSKIHPKTCPLRLKNLKLVTFDPPSFQVSFSELSQAMWLLRHLKNLVKFDSRSHYPQRFRRKPKSLNHQV